nr:iron-containing alcohol dehydrogenase [Deltaproteobacteria bacterium]
IPGTAPIAPERHLDIARALGVDLHGAAPEDRGPALAHHARALVEAVGAPVELASLGLGLDVLPALVEGAFAQQRLLANAPLVVTRELLAAWFTAATL